MSVRLRFAPSPTGDFHVGGAWMVLFNWLVARQKGGTLVLRIEDTDIERNQPEWVLTIQESIRWLGLDWDEGPFFQSERGALYDDAVARLSAGGSTYWCDCTPDDLKARVENAQLGYDNHCRDRGLESGPGRALRFRVPEGSTTVQDVIRGEPTFDHASIRDFVIVRSNGSPIFILANVVDDIDMRITHVIRGEEHLSNVPKALMLWDALGGGEPPVFAHLPLLVNEQRRKLSKRRPEDHADLGEYRELGFLSEAMCNYLLLLGWSPPDGRELFTVEEMVEHFRLEEVNNSPAFFDRKKLLHINGEYIRALSTNEFIGAVGPFLGRLGTWAPGDFDFGDFDRIAPLVQERVTMLSDAPAMVEFLFLAEPDVDEADFDKLVVRGPSARDVLVDAIAEFATCEWQAATLHDLTAAIGERHGLNLKKAHFPIRIAVTGRRLGLPLFESLEVLGRERTIERLERALARLDAG